MEEIMPSGSYTFFDTLTVNWTYDAAKQQLTVTATLSGKNIGTDVLTPTNRTGEIQGSNGNNTATLNLAANFTTSVLSMQASQTDPAKNGNTQSSF
jgi:hypothetical protein